MDKKPASSSAIIFHILIATVLFFLIDQLADSHPWVKATCLMAWGTFFLIDFLRLFTKGKENWTMLGALVLLGVGSTLGCLFLVWAGNALLKLTNTLFFALEWEFRIGNLFNGIYNFVFSVPSLICGVIMALTALSWDNKPFLKKWSTPFLKGKSYSR